jgi:hypothetical protein
LNQGIQRIAKSARPLMPGVRLTLRAEEMKYSDSDTIQKFEEQITGLELLLKLATFTPFLFGGVKKVKELKKQARDLRKQLSEMKQIPDEFNTIFSKAGWIAYDSLSMDFMKSQINLAKTGKYDDAIDYFRKYYDEDRINFEILLLNRTDVTRIRLPLVKLAFEDYKEDRFHAMIPVILMMIDGIVNDVVGKGFHTESQELDAWDSIITIDNGLEVIQAIFKKGRFKTRIEEIYEPYRNGILHGIDLGYANNKVALKCWHYLFVIRDWAQSKLNEEERQKKFIKDNTPPDIKETLSKLQHNDVVKKELAKWKPEEFSEKYIHDINLSNKNIKTEQPEYVVSQFFQFLQKKNFKALSEIFWKNYFYSGQNKIATVKTEFNKIGYSSFQFTKIINEAPVITEIYVKTNSNSLKFRMIYESNSDDVSMPVLRNGRWKIVGIQEV